MNAIIFYSSKARMLLFFVAALLITGCVAGTDNKGEAKKEVERPATPKTVTVPRFDANSAYGFIEKQLSFGPRVPGSEGHRNCKDWLVETLESFGAEVIKQDFKAVIYTGESLPATNIIARFNPMNPRRVMLAAHWDTRFQADQEKDASRRKEAIPGADDGGSGVAVLLEIGRLIEEFPIDLGVDIVFFDAEDQGFDAETAAESRAETWCLGAQYWSNNLHVPDYRPLYGILLDMVGAKDARFVKEGVSMRFAPRVMNKVWKLAGEMGYGNFFVNELSPGGITDDHLFVNTIAKIPMIDIINRSNTTETGFGSHWHTHDDDINVISKRTLKASGQVVLAVIYNEAGGVF